MTTPASAARLVGAALIAGLMTALAAPGAARADDHRFEHRPDVRVRPMPFRGDIHRFHEHDWSVWRGGRWVHGPHNGRPGWWWVVGPTWYFYPAPVYPYPNPWEPPAADLVTPAPDAPPPTTQFWYWCDSAQQYYPYVASCPGGWKQVPAQPTR